MKSKPIILNQNFYNFNIIRNNQNIYFNNNMNMPNNNVNNQMNNNINMQNNNQMNNNINMTNNNINNPINNNISQIAEDVYPYIEEDKKNIIFKRYDDSIKSVKIPKSLRKNELYSTANKYKKYKYADILSLSLNGRNLNKDESSIDDINDGSEIYIIEELKDVDSEYYKNYLKEHDKEELITIIFNYNDLKSSFRFSYNSTIKEMLKIYLFKTNIPEKYKEDYIFIYNADTIIGEDNLIKDKIKGNNSLINVLDKSNLKHSKNEGIILKASIKSNNKLIKTYDIGTLNQIKDFNSFLRKNINNYDKIKEIKINGNINNYDENKTFSSIGIRKDFDCEIKYKEDEENKRKKGYKKTLICCTII